MIHMAYIDMDEREKFFKSDKPWEEKTKPPKINPNIKPLTTKRLESHVRLLEAVNDELQNKIKLLEEELAIYRSIEL